MSLYGKCGSEVPNIGYYRARNRILNPKFTPNPQKSEKKNDSHVNKEQKEHQDLLKYSQNKRAEFIAKLDRYHGLTNTPSKPNDVASAKKTTLIRADLQKSSNQNLQQIDSMTPQGGLGSRNFTNNGGSPNQNIGNNPLNANVNSYSRVEKLPVLQNHQIKNGNANVQRNPITGQVMEYNTSFNTISTFNTTSSKPLGVNKACNDNQISAKYLQEQIKNADQLRNSSKDVVATVSTDLQLRLSRIDTRIPSKESESKQAQVVEKDSNSSSESSVLRNRSKTVDHKKLFFSKPIGINNEGNTCYL